MLYPEDFEFHIELFLYLKDRAGKLSLDSEYPQPDPECGCCGNGYKVCGACKATLKGLARNYLDAMAGAYNNVAHVPYLAVTAELERRSDQQHGRNNHKDEYSATTVTFLGRVRKKFGLNQKQMALRLGISERQVRSVESGRKLLSDEKAQKLISFATQKGMRKWKYPADRFWDYALPEDVPDGGILERDHDKAEPTGPNLQGSSGTEQRDSPKAA